MHYESYGGQKHDLNNIPVEYRMTVHPFGVVFFSIFVQIMLFNKQHLILDTWSCLKSRMQLTQIST